ncbi:MAG: hypothetical protein ABI618_02590, partial [Nitrospirota bacterium]
EKTQEAPELFSQETLSGIAQRRLGHVFESTWPTDMSLLNEEQRHRRIKVIRTRRSTRFGIGGDLSSHSSAFEIGRVQSIFRKNVQVSMGLALYGSRFFI